MLKSILIDRGTNGSSYTGSHEGRIFYLEFLGMFFHRENPNVNNVKSQNRRPPQKIAKSMDLSPPFQISNMIMYESMAFYKNDFRAFF